MADPMASEQELDNTDSDNSNDIDDLFVSMVSDNLKDLDSTAIEEDLYQVSTVLNYLDTIESCVLMTCPHEFGGEMFEALKYSFRHAPDPIIPSDLEIKDNDDFDYSQYEYISGSIFRQFMGPIINITQSFYLHNIDSGILFCCLGFDVLIKVIMDFRTELFNNEMFDADDIMMPTDSLDFLRSSSPFASVRSEDFEKILDLFDHYLMTEEMIDGDAEINSAFMTFWRKVTETFGEYSREEIIYIAFDLITMIGDGICTVSNLQDSANFHTAIHDFFNNQRTDLSSAMLGNKD